jgi:hypothetical protein
MGRNRLEQKRHVVCARGGVSAGRRGGGGRAAEGIEGGREGWGLGFGVWGCRLGIYGLGCRVQGLGCGSGRRETPRQVC